ncbi:unnamed protein product, partial [Mesorhabditis belari]|uniref:Uncharacterized protein n=1 Tax=Mesorhabditis belari TaxID=2138241 RepID=A0AAF3F9W1_9BILA
MWIADIFNVRLTIVSATISLDFILIYKMIKSKKTVNHASERFLFAQIVANNLPFTYCYLLAPFLFITIMPWAPMFSDFIYYFGNLLLYTGSHLYQAIVTIYLLRKDERKNVIRNSSAVR